MIMALLAAKVIGPADVRRYIVDFGDWLDQSETISSDAVTITVDTVDGGPTTPLPIATVTNISVSPDGQSLVFYVNGNDSPTAPVTIGTQFAVNVKIVTVVGGSPPGQTTYNHIAFTVVAS